MGPEAFGKALEVFIKEVTLSNDAVNGVSVDGRQKDGIPMVTIYVRPGCSEEEKREILNSINGRFFQFVEMGKGRIFADQREQKLRKILRELAEHCGVYPDELDTATEELMQEIGPLAG